MTGFYKLGRVATIKLGRQRISQKKRRQRKQLEISKLISIPQGRKKTKN